MKTIKIIGVASQYKDKPITVSYYTPQGNTLSLELLIELNGNKVIYEYWSKKQSAKRK